ncbi:unnamed protein product [Brassica oleracea var. botrytis]
MSTQATGTSSTSGRRRGPPPPPSKKPDQSEHHGSFVNNLPNSPQPPSNVERTVKKLRLDKAITIPEGTTVFDACRRMAARRVGAILLTNSSSLLSGICTDKDIASRVIAEGLKPDQTPVSKVMTRNPVFVTSDSLALDALQKMVQGRFRHLPVVENGEVIAMLDITKCLYDAISRMEKAAEQGSALAAAVEGVGGGAGGYGFIETLREGMFKPALSTIITDSSKVVLVAPSDSVYVAAKRMRDLRVNSVIISMGSKIQGILTSKDILMRLVVQNLSPETILVEKVMTPSPECVSLETTILDALHTMHDGRFLHLPVLDKDGSVAACVDVLQITHAAISMVENSSGAVNDVANTMMQKFWDSALALDPVDHDSDGHSEMSGTMMMMHRHSDIGKLTSCPSLELENSFSFKVKDLKGRVHRFSSGGESLEELMGVVMQRIGIDVEEQRPQIVYEDDEGDKVLITSDSDLVGAVALARSTGQKVLRLFLDFTETETRSLGLETGQLKKVSTLDGKGCGGWVTWRGGVVVTGAVVITSVAVVVYLKRSKT